MGIVERKEKQKQEIRKMILDASMKLFVEQGFANVTIRKIADLIEYSPTTVYLYFKDKDEIFFGLHDEGFQKMQALNKNLDEIANPLLRLHKMGENYINFGLDNPEYYDVMFIQLEPMHSLNEMACSDWEYGDAAMARLKNTIRDCMEQGYLAEGNVDLVSMSVWSLVHGLVSLAIRERMEKFVPDKEMIRPTLLYSVNWFISSIEARREGQQKKDHGEEKPAKVGRKGNQKKGNEGKEGEGKESKVKDAAEARKVSQASRASKKK